LADDQEPIDHRQSRQGIVLCHTVGGKLGVKVSELEQVADQCGLLCDGTLGNLF
jgi:hypothetical protein